MPRTKNNKETQAKKDSNHSKPSQAHNHAHTHSPAHKNTNNKKHKTKEPSNKHLQAEASFAKEIKALTKQVQRLRDTELLHVYKKPWKFLWFSFWKGMMIGLGSVIGASLLVGIFMYLMGKVSLVPFLGDVVQDVLTEIDIQNIFTDIK